MTATFKRSETQSAVRSFSESGVYGDELGPFATFCAQLVVFAGFLIAFTPFEGLPGKAPYGLLFGAVGVFLLAPRNSIKKLPISLSVLTFVGLMLLSVLWTNNTAGTVYSLTGTVPVVISFAVVAGLLKFEDLLSAVLWIIRFSLLVTLVAVVVDPSTHQHFGDQYGDQPLPGWHGWYNHKNSMAPYFAFGALTVAMFDRNQVTRWLTVTGLVFMIVMSDSSTAIFAVVLMLGVWWWLVHFASLDDRSGVTFFGSTFGLGLLAVIGGFASTTTLTSAAGKDASLSGRTDIWAGSFEALMERPFFGYGVNGLYWGDPVTIEAVEIWRRIGFEAQHAHQGLLDIAVQLGLLGATLFCGMFYSTFNGGWRMIRTNPKLGLWIVTIMSGQIFMSLSENVLTGNWLAILVIFRLASLRRHGVKFPERKANVRRPRALV